MSIDVGISDAYHCSVYWCSSEFGLTIIAQAFKKNILTEKPTDSLDIFNISTKIWCEYDATAEARSTTNRCHYQNKGSFINCVTRVSQGWVG